MSATVGGLEPPRKNSEGLSPVLFYTDDHLQMLFKEIQCGLDDALTLAKNTVSVPWLEVLRSPSASLQQYLLYDINSLLPEPRSCTFAVAFVRIPPPQRG